jgi:hypothetical protein
LHDPDLDSYFNEWSATRRFLQQARENSSAAAAALAAVAFFGLRVIVN